MTGFVLDCSVAMSWCFESEADAYGDAALRALSRTTALVPAIWPLEVVNVLLLGERRRRISRTESLRFLDAIAELPITVDRPADLRTLSTPLTLGQEHGLSAYDVAYLQLAMRERLPLATRDRRLRQVADTAGVAAFRAR